MSRTAISNRNGTNEWARSSWHKLEQFLSDENNDLDKPSICVCLRYVGVNIYRIWLAVWRHISPSEWFDNMKNIVQGTLYSHLSESTVLYQYTMDEYWRVWVLNCIFWFILHLWLLLSWIYVQPMTDLQSLRNLTK